jgi:hypothetical protein
MSKHGVFALPLRLIAAILFITLLIPLSLTLLSLFSRISREKRFLENANQIVSTMERLRASDWGRFR